MKDIIKALLDDYVRKTLVSFTDSDMSKYLLKKKHPCSIEKIQEYIKSSPNIFMDLYGNFISRAGLFTSKYFSFAPTKMEIENGYLIFGHRGMPFVDPSFLPDRFGIFFLGEVVPEKVIEINSAEVYPYFKYFGEEYVPQIVAQDFANFGLDLAETDYVLPPKIKLTVLDFSEIYKKYNFKLGDRIVASISDWDAGLINIAPFVRRGKNPFEQSSVDRKREQWEESFEKALSFSLEEFGPCSSIEEQLAFAFLSDIDKFSVPHCSSFQEVIEKSNKFEFTLYGVETRLWFKNKEIPAMSSQMISFPDDEIQNDAKKDNKIVNIFNKYNLIIPSWIIDAFIYDALFNKETDLNKILEKIIPDLIVLEKEEYNAVMLHLEKKHAIIRKEYNWFADFHYAEIRHEALNLFTKLFYLFYEIEYQKIDITKLDQQHLIVLSQLSAHISTILSSLMPNDEITEKELETLKSSMEGMFYSFEESSKVIKENLLEFQKQTFGKNLKIGDCDNYE